MAQHFTFAERQFLQRMVKARKSKAEIGAIMNRHRSTIYRELQRNSTAWGYRSQTAQRLAEKRRAACRRPYKLKDLSLRLYVSERLRKAWSPDQIAGRLRHDFPHEPQRHVSPPTIYAWLARRAHPLRRWLRRANRKSQHRLEKPAEVRIQGRPAVINRRRRYGDWEGDTIVSRGRRSGLVTLVERKSGLVRMGKLDNLRSATTMKVARRCLKDLPSTLRRSTTFDNGTEFTAYQVLSQTLGMTVYFADPYCAWQRGSNENLNGLVRQYFPKGTDFSQVARREVQRVEKSLNERPRRRLNYQTPLEVIRQQMCRI
jgi:transposase, IS30 family